MEHLYVIDFLSTLEKLILTSQFTDVVMFDGASNVQLAGELLKIHYPNITVMRRVDHTVSLFFNYVSKVPVDNKMITAHKAIFNIFGSGIYQTFTVRSSLFFLKINLVLLTKIIAGVYVSRWCIFLMLVGFSKGGINSQHSILDLHK